jgi:hypothetical protein
VSGFPVVGSRHCTCLLCILASSNVLSIYAITATGFCLLQGDFCSAVGSCRPADPVSVFVVVGGLLCACSHRILAAFSMVCIG